MSPVRYRYSADEGKEVPVESEEERLERVEREARALRDAEFEREEELRKARAAGPYL